MITFRRSLIAIAALSVVTAIGVAVALPPWISGKATTAIADLQDTYGVDLTVADVQVGLLGSFPRATVTLRDLHVTNRAPFEGVEILKAGELQVKVDVMALWAGNTEIQGLSLTDAAIDLRVDGEKANWDLGPESTVTEPSTYAIQLDDVRLDNVDFGYRDSEGTYARITGITSRTTGNVGSDAVTLKTESSGKLSVGSADGATLTDTPFQVEGPFARQSADGRMDLDQMRIRLGELPLRLNGSATPTADGWAIDMALSAPKATFASVLSLLPPGTLGKGVSATGTFGLDATFKGNYAGDTYPGATLDLEVADASVASGADRIEQLRFDTHVERTEGPLDRTKVSVRNGHAVVASSPIDFDVSLDAPLSDPFVDLTAKGLLDLGAVDRATGGELGVAGKLDVDVAVAGKASSFSETAPGKASGKVRGKGVTMPLDGFPDPLVIDDFDLGFGPTQFDLRTLDLHTGPTDLSVNGTLTQVIPYALGQAPLGGKLAVRSQTIDLRTLASDSGSTESDAATIVTVPTDLELDVDIDVGQIYQGDYHLTNLKGGVGVHQGKLSLHKVAFRTMGGVVKLDGDYAAPTTDGADVDMDLSFEGLAMDELMKTMDTARNAIPAAARAGGKVGGATSVQTRLLPDTSPDLPTLFAEGLLLTVGSSMAPDILKGLADKLNDPKIANMNLDGARFDYQVEKGRLSFKPVPVKLGSQPATLEGGAGIIDQTVDLALNFAMATKGLESAGLKLPKGASNIDVAATISGPYNKPKLGVKVAGLDDLVDAVKDQVVDAVKGEASKWIAEAEKQGDKLIAEAEKIADGLKAEASKASASLKKEAKKQADKLASSAGNPIAKAAAEKAGDALIKEADKAAKKLESDAGKKADGLVAEAKKQKTQLVADAKKRTD